MIDRELFRGEAGLLAVDGGQSITKVRYRSPDGSCVEVDLPGVRTDLELLPQLGAVAVEASRRFGEIGIAVFGVSGLTARDRHPAPILEAAEDAGVRAVGLAHDSVTAYLATLGTQPGVVIASGTGVVTFAVGAERTARVDGWGYIMGDAGSGYWIGREAMDAVMRAFDGRGPSTALTAVVQQTYPDLAGAYIQLQAEPARVSRVASFARAVAELAESDEVASRIVDRAAEELALSATTAWERVGGAGEGPRVRTLGGVFRSDAIATRFARLVSARHPGAVIGHGTANALDGVEALVDTDPNGPFAPHVTWAFAPQDAVL
jgi:N-acetylglucosamine kinase-like BadF-type ATPase